MSACKLGGGPPPAPFDQSMVDMVKNLKHDMQSIVPPYDNETRVLCALINYRAAQLVGEKLDNIAGQLAQIQEMHWRLSTR